MDQDSIFELEHLGGNKKRYRLIWRGEAIADSVTKQPDCSSRPFIKVLSEEAIRPLLSESFETLAACFSGLHIKPIFAWQSELMQWSKKNRISFSVNLTAPAAPDDEWRTVPDTARVAYEVVNSLQDWENPWTPAAFLNAMNTRARILTADPDEQLAGNLKSAYSHFRITLPVARQNTLGEAITAHRQVLFDILDTAAAELSQHASRAAITQSFHFPPECAAACEQYLLYFAQFLRDLGMNAEAGIHHRDRETLFTVIPGDQETALDQIRVALRDYLRMPNDDRFDSAADEVGSVPTFQLQANIHHLRGQLSLAAATIKTQQIAIATLEQGVNRSAPDMDTEQLLPGVRVKRYELYGVEFDLPKLLRRLKRVARKDDSDLPRIS